ncbi:PD40 domain-containing protein [bacterium]|nr:PD40 domain-containing protein [bacterium]
MTRTFFYLLYIGLLFSCRDTSDTTGDDAIASNLSGKLVFQSNRTGDFEVFATNSSGTGITNITDNTSDDIYPSVSLNGKKVAYLSYREGTPNIYIYQNNVSTKITSDDSEYSVLQISRKGDKAVFIRNHNLYVMTSSGTGITQLTYNGVDTANYSPTFSYDDAKLTFTRNIKGGNSDILLMSGLGGPIQNLTDGIGDNLFPAFSPDGTQIVFTRNNHISILTIATKAIVDLMPTDSLRFNGYPVFSPDGNTIAFVTNRTGNMEIFTMKKNGQAVTNITENDAMDTHPYWSE